MSRKQIAGLAGAIALSLGGITTGAQAEDEKREFSYYLTITGASDYMFRGISYTDQDPTVNVYQEVDYGIAYLALWTSNIDYYPYGSWEQDIYLGIRPTTGPINWDLAANWYIYGNEDKGAFGSTSDIDYFEFKIGASTNIAPNLTAGALLWLTPDQGYAATSNVSIEGTLAYDLPKVAMFAPTLSGLIGYSDSGTNEYYPDGYWVGQETYTYWNAGLKLTADKFFMDLRYWDTTIDNPLTDARFVFSAGVNLLP